MKLNNNTSELNTRINNLSIVMPEDVNSSVADLVNHMFSIDRRLYWDVFKQVRELNIFSNESIDDDWAIEDLVKALDEWSFILVAKLAKWNECSNVWNNAFKAYSEIMRWFWLNITENYLRNLV